MPSPAMGPPMQKVTIHLMTAGQASSGSRAGFRCNHPGGKSLAGRSRVYPDHGTGGQQRRQLPARFQSVALFRRQAIPEQRPGRAGRRATPLPDRAGKAAGEPMMMRFAGGQQMDEAGVAEYDRSTSARSPP